MMPRKTRLPDWFGCLSRVATPRNDQTTRRRLPAEQDEDGWRFAFLNPFELDFLKILESKALRRLADKTQVITRTDTETISFDKTLHIRNRLTHTFDVVGLAGTMASALGLNIPLVRAGALGHDLGHLPLGHTSEFFFQEQGLPVRHENFGVYLAQFIERRVPGGLNLTISTLKIINRHSRGRGNLNLGQELSPEERLVLYADKMAYLSADPTDIFVKFRRMLNQDSSLNPLANQLDGKWPLIRDLLQSFLPNSAPPNQRELQRCWVNALGEESADRGCVSFENSPTAQLFARLRSEMMDIYQLVDFRHFAGNEPLTRAYRLLEKLGSDQGVNPVILFALLGDRELFRITELPPEAKCIPKDILQKISLADILPFLARTPLPPLEPWLDW